MKCLLCCISLVCFITVLIMVLRGILIDIFAVKADRIHRNRFIDWCKQDFDKLYEDESDWAEFEAQRMEDWLWS